MFAHNIPLPVHTPFMVCPSCESAALCAAVTEESLRDNAVKVLRCPYCGVYHSLNLSATTPALFASPVGA